MKNVLPSVLASLVNTPPCLAPDVDGQTSPRVRMLLNRLVATIPPDESYFEVGCLKGATLISALLDHHNIDAYACDNFSLFKELEADKYLLANLKRYGSRLPSVKFFNEDCFGLPAKKPFNRPIGLFFYDGDHKCAAQKLAVTAFLPLLAKNAIMIIDDWNWDYVRTGTFDGLKEANPKKIEKYEIICGGPPNGDVNSWWNGIGAFYVEQA